MIRPARAEDAFAIVELEREAFSSDAWSLAQVENELTVPTRRVLVADAGGVQGYAAISVAGDVADLTRIVVSQPQRRSGVASELLAELQEAAAEAGAIRVLLEVAAGNVGAVAFYEAHGYSEIARRANYYANGDDALVLARALG